MGQRSKKTVILKGLKGYAGPSKIFVGRAARCRRGRKRVPSFFKLSPFSSSVSCSRPLDHFQLSRGVLTPPSADRVVAGGVFSLDQQQRSWLRHGGMLRGQACETGNGFMECCSGEARPLISAPAAEDEDKGRSASCENRRWQSTGFKGTVVARWELALHATECRGEAGMSEEASDRTVLSGEKCCRDVLNASRAHSSLSSRPSLHVSSHSVASAAVGVGLRSWSVFAAAGVRSWSAASCFVRARGCMVGANSCRNVTARCVRFQYPRDRMGNSWSDTVRSQGPTGRRCTKGGVSGPAEDLRPVPEVETGVNFRLAGRVRGQVAGSLPGRQPGTGTRTNKGSVVTPSLHPEVRIRQLMGWTKVCGTTQSGIWVLKGNARTCMFPANLDHLRVGWMKQGSYKTAWVTPGHDCLCPYKYGHGAAVRPQTNKAIWDGVISLWGRVGVVRRN